MNTYNNCIIEVVKQSILLDNDLKNDRDLNYDKQYSYIDGMVNAISICHNKLVCNVFDDVKYIKMCITKSKNTRLSDLYDDDDNVNVNVLQSLKFQDIEDIIM